MLKKADINQILDEINSVSYDSESMDSESDDSNTVTLILEDSTRKIEEIDSKFLENF
jgi:hypothetical protein